jgi:hypothetical protein
MIKKKKKYDYYKLDVGFYPDVVKLCFDDTVFQQILKDHDIKLKSSALDYGIAETHVIGDGKDAIIILVFDMSLINDDISELVDTIAHEICHAVDNLAEHIGEDEGFKGETRAYLTGHLAKQVFKICMHEKEKSARKTNRSKTQQVSKTKRGVVSEVYILSDGSTRSHSAAELEDIICGAENTDGSIEQETRTGF